VTHVAALRPAFHRSLTRPEHPGAVVDGWIDALRPGDVVLHARRGRPTERRSLRFRDPATTLTLEDPTETSALLAALDEHLRAGRAVAGYLGYEAGSALVGAPMGRRPPYALGWFGVYDAVEIVAAGAGGAPLSAPRDAHGTVHDVIAELDEATWHERALEVARRLAAGETYQVNLTTGYRCRVDDVREAYRALSASQAVAYGALLDTGEIAVASASPELFVHAQSTSDGVSLHTRPMKGTAARGAHLEEDAAAAEALRADPKARAENVMIVDLLRHDLGRLARPGSVHVPRLLDVERYRSVLQLTSTVAATAPSDTGLTALLGALFPCGSITGAPKRRTMELIAALEDVPRGVYTGAIGFALPASDTGDPARMGAESPFDEAVFSVAIRTLVVQGGVGRLGVGGGLVADSEPALEHAELRLKARFFTEPAPPLRLFETMRWAAGQVQRWPAHVERLRRSAAYHEVPFAEDAAERAVADAVAVVWHPASDGSAPPPAALRVRLELHEDGACTAVATPFREPEAAAAPVRIALARPTVQTDDPRRRHKTTDRALYDRATRWARAQGVADVVFVNEFGAVAEGAISTVFVRDDDGQWRTPPLSDGALPGVLRAELLAQGTAREGAVTPLDLQSRAVAIGNALRGLRPAWFDPTIVWDEHEEATP
jgi:para-aminobenzoate synthetase / 4-amino-4-deoxychorismate lyase